MNFKTLIAAAILVVALGMSAFAQQDPNDGGAMDSIFLVLSQPEAGADDSTFILETWFFNDENTVATAGLGYTWDNPNVVLDSARKEPAAGGLDFSPFFFYKNSLDSSNFYQICQVGVARLFGPGLEPSAAPKHVATHFFHITDWTVNDTICVDSIQFSGATLGTFVDPVSGEYPVAFRGGCVGDPNAPSLGTLVTEPTELAYEGEAGGANPAFQTFGVTELDGGNIDYTATADQDWIVLSDANGTTPGTVTVDVDLTGLAPDTYTGQVSVTSADAGNTATVDITLTVTLSNQAPIWTDIPDQVVDEGQLLAFGVSATDPDEDALTLNTSTLPAGATFTDNGDGTGDFSWTPDFTQADLYTVIFTATDGDLSTADTVTITVNNVNRAPELTEVLPQEVIENSPLSFGITAADPDEDALTLVAEGLPTGAAFVDNEDGTGTFDWTPNDGDAGQYTVTFIASDGDLADTIMVDIEVLPDAEFAQLQIIHNAADPGAGVVDVWVNGEVFQEDFAFRTATPFLSVPAGVDLTVGVSAPDAVEPLVEFSPLNLTADVAYVAIANGVIDDTQFEANPDGRSIALTVFAIENAQTTGTDGANIDFAALHGATDAPTVDVIARGVTTLVDNAAYGDIAPYQSVPAAEYILDVTPGDDTATVVASFTADLSGVGGRAAVVFASGFLTPDNDQGGAAFGLFAALDDGTVVEFPLIVPAKELVVTPASFDFEFPEGDETPYGGTLNVSEVGDSEIGFFVFKDTDFVAITLMDTIGTTPGTADFQVVSGLTEGVYSGNIYVGSEEADNTVEVPVTITVTGCPQLQPASIVYDVTIIEGETATVVDTVELTSSTGEELAFMAVSNDFFTFAPEDGTTPEMLQIDYSHMFMTAGFYADTTVITAALPEPIEKGVDACESQTEVIVNVTVNRPPSADTVIAVNTPAVPGMHVGVPVTFSNSCTLTELGIGFEWMSEYIMLDSVSFDGTVIADFGFQTEVVIDNDANTVLIEGADQGMGIPAGSDRLWATLYFTLMCEIENGDYPLTLLDGAFGGVTNPYFGRNCGEGTEMEMPEYIQGSIVVGTATNFVCGYVVDNEMNEIEGATVELWGDFPTGSVELSTLTTGIGSFFFDDFTTIPFDLYAYADGYYPGLVENINFGDKGIVIVLEPLQELTPTSEWVDYYCPEGSNLYFGGPLPVGAVVEAFTQDGLLVGQKTVTEAGQYGFMPVYRASSEFNDDGAVTGDNISFKVNQFAAIATGNTEYPSEYMQMPVCLEVRGSAEKECELVEGWNLVSWNVDTDTDAIMDVLDPIMGNVDVVLGFEGGGLTFDPDLQDFSTLWNVDHLSGYWIRIEEGAGPQTLTVTGLPVPVSTPIAIATGWNLVSYLPEDDLDPDIALATILDNLSVAYGFTPGVGVEIFRADGGEFNTLTTMSSCNGYWIKSDAEDLLMYPDGGVVPAVTGPVAKTAAPREPGVLSTTSWINLYASDLTVDGRTAEAGTVITAHASDNDALIGRFQMRTDGKFGFMPVYADASGRAATGFKPGESFYLRVNDVPTKESFDWTTNGSRVEVAHLTTANGGTLPMTYSLGQYYPNPFNPSTNISFTLPSAGQAKIEVFNILGRHIATPFEGVAEAGENTVIWDGTDASGQPVASGVYLYRLSADTYVESRKMMLLK
ncbi:DUF4397 domain-containing protein [candidate division GN15 bacterium]|nr:DUF4397 domain-containing protein [candidate division GN15 bacterium]